MNSKDENADMERRVAMPESVIPDKKFDMDNLKKRVVSALVLVPLVLLVTYQGGIVFDLAVVMVMAIGMYEWLRMLAPNSTLLMKVMLFSGLLIVLLFREENYDVILLGVVLGAVLTVVLFLYAMYKKEKNALLIALGIPYLAGGGLALIQIRLIELEWVVYLMGTVWAMDIGAFLAGKIIGGPKLCPKISPKKTWAGLLGGIVLAAIFGYCANLGGYNNPWLIIGLSSVLALVSQGGDFFESYVKRRSGVKDSGNLIPGHGGMLDRIDGLLFASIFGFLLILFL